MRTILISIALFLTVSAKAQPGCPFYHEHFFVLDVSYADGYSPENTTLTLVNEKNEPVYNYQIVDDIPLKIEATTPRTFWKNEPQKKKSKSTYGLQGYYADKLSTDFYITIMEENLDLTTNVNTPIYQVRIETFKDQVKEEQLIYLPSEKALNACQNKLINNPSKTTQLVQLNGETFTPIKITVGDYRQPEQKQPEKTFIQYYFNETYDDYGRPIKQKVEKVIVRDAADFEVIQTIIPDSADYFYAHNRDEILGQLNQKQFSDYSFPPITIPTQNSSFLKKPSVFYDYYEFDIDSNKYIKNSLLSGIENVKWDFRINRYRRFAYEKEGDEWFWKEWQLIDSIWTEITAEKATWLKERYGPEKTDLSCYQWPHGNYLMLPVIETDGASQFHFFNKVLPFDSTCNRPWELKLRNTDGKIKIKELPNHQKALELRDSVWIFENRIYIAKTGAFHHVENRMEQPFWIEYFGVSKNLAVQNELGNTFAYEEQINDQLTLRLNVDQQNYPISMGMIFNPSQHKIGTWTYWKDHLHPSFDSIQTATLNLVVQNTMGETPTIEVKHDDQWFKPNFTESGNAFQIYLPLKSDSIRISTSSRKATYSFLQFPLKTTTSLYLNLLNPNDDYITTSGVMTEIQFIKDYWVVNWDYTYFKNKDFSQSLSSLIDSLRQAFPEVKFEFGLDNRLLAHKEMADYDDLIPITIHPAIESLCKLIKFSGQETYFNNEIWIDFADGYFELNKDFVFESMNLKKSIHQDGNMNPFEKFESTETLLDERLIRRLNSMVNTGIIHNYSLNWHLRVEFDE